MPDLDLRSSSLIASCGLGKQVVFPDSTDRFSITAFFFFFFLPKKRINFEPPKSNKSSEASNKYFSSRSAVQILPVRSIIAHTMGRKKR